MTATAWAQLSNNLVYGAMAAYAVALVVLAAETAFGGRGRVGRTVQAAEAVRATAPTAVAAGGGRAPVDAPATPATPAGPGAPASPDGSRAADEADRAARLARVGTSVFVLGTALLVGAVVARGLAAGRVPWGNMYEYALVGSAVAAGAFLAIARRTDVRALALWVVTALLLALGLAVTVLYVDAGPLVPALDSLWLVIHVSAATIATGLFTVAAIATGVHLVAVRTARRPGGAPAALARPERFDALAYRVTAFAFPIWTFAVLAGAIWAEAAWGRYWGWDPKEVWAFVTWVAYAAYLHARATAGWRGTRASWVGLAAYASLLFNFFGVNIFFAGLHSYGGV